VIKLNDKIKNLEMKYTKPFRFSSEQVKLVDVLNKEITVSDYEIVRYNDFYYSTCKYSNDDYAFAQILISGKKRMLLIEKGEKRMLEFLDAFKASMPYQCCVVGKIGNTRMKYLKSSSFYGDWINLSDILNKKMIVYSYKKVKPSEIYTVGSRYPFGTYAFVQIEVEGKKRILETVPDDAEILKLLDANSGLMPYQCCITSEMTE